MSIPWRRLIIAPGQVTLDGEMIPLAEPLRAEDFAADWFLLWLAANPDPHLPDAAIRRAQEIVAAEWLRDLGRRLFERAFPGELAGRLRTGDVPLALSFDEPPPDPAARVPVAVGDFAFETPVPRLSDLPWELLYDDHFLTRTQTIIRILQPSSPLPSPTVGRGEGAGGGVRALVALAAPLLNPDLPPDDPRQPAIFDLEREAELFQSLEGALFPVNFTLLPHATPAGLDAALRHCDVFHFVGHGNVGLLALENRDGTHHGVETAWLRERFSVRPPRLALFTSCLTGAAVAGMDSVAQTLLEAGVPLALAMLQSVSDRAARAFYRRLYAEMGAGAPLHEAAAAARRAVADEPDLPPWEWATPAIFARPEALERPDLWSFPAGEGPATVSEPKKPDLPPLVPRPRPFVGRRAELVRVARGIDPDDGVPLTLLHGEGGMGKTALAAEAMHRWADRFSHVLWLSARDVVPVAPLAEQLADVPYRAGLRGERPADALFLQALGRALGLEVHGDEPAGDLVAPILAVLRGKRRWLLVLDNLETVADSPAVRQLLAALPRSARCLATSRHRLGVNATEVELTGLYPREVGELLARYAEAKGVLVSDEAATELYRRAGGHPMTLRLVVAQVKARAVTWEQALKGLADAGAETWRDAFEYVFGRSLEAAGEEGRRAFALLALFTPFTRREIWQAATGWEEAPFGRALARLRDLSLAEAAPREELYRLQELARAQAEHLLRSVPEEELAAAKVRAARALGELARMLNNNLTPDDERRAFAEQQAQASGRSVEEVERALVQAVLATFDLERENLLSAVEWAFEGEEWDLVMRLVARQHEWQNIRALWADRERNDLQAVEAARRAGDRHGEGGALMNLGSVYLQQGRWTEAIGCYEQSQEIMRDLGDRHGEGQTLNNLGSVYLRQGRWTETITCYEQGQEIMRDLGDRHGEGQTLNNLGNVYRLQSRWAEAIACYEQSLEIVRDLNDWYGESITLMNLGSVYSQQGRWAEAIGCYKRSLAIRRDLSDRHGEGQTLTNLGNAYLQQGRWTEAIGCYEQGLEILRDLGDRHGEGQTLNNLGIVYRQQGRWAEAIACYEQDLVICRDLGDRHGEGTALMNLGNVYTQQGDWAEAIGCYKQSLAIRRDLSDRHGEGQTLTNLGEFYRRQDRWPEAIGYYEQSLEISRDLGDRHGEGIAVMNLGSVYLQQGRRTKAITCYEQSLEISRDLGDRHGEGQTLTNLGLIYQDEGRLEEALDAYQRSLSILLKVGDYPGAVAARGNLAGILLQRGQAEQAIAHYAQALLLALQIHFRPVVEVLNDVVKTAKELARVGMLAEVEQLGEAGFQAVQQAAQRGWRDVELEQVGELAHNLCATLALLGRSRGDVASPDFAQALEGARAVDAATGGAWGLEAWLRELSTDWGAD